MEIMIRWNESFYPIIVNENDTIGDLKEKIIENIIKKHPHNSHYFKLSFRGILIPGKENKKLKDFNIKQKVIMIINTTSHLIELGGSIDNLAIESETLKAKKIGFDMSLIKRNALHINLIHFDFNMTNGENYRYYNNFKVDVVGGFYAIDDVNIFKKYLQKISEKHIPFLVVCSGKSGKEIIPICKQYSFVKEVIIFCMNYSYNKHYIEEYSGYVKKVTTSIDELYDYLKKFYGNEKLCKECFPNVPFQFYDNEIKMDKQIQECPIITKEEYDKCYFLVHRAYAYFFGNFNSKNHSFDDEGYKIIEDLLRNLF